MHTNEIRSGVFLYLCSNPNAMTMEDKVPFTPKTNPMRGKLFLNQTFEFHDTLQDNGSHVFDYGTHLDSFQSQYNWNMNPIFHHISMHAYPLMIVNSRHLICTQSKESKILHNSFRVLQHNFMHALCHFPPTTISIVFLWVVLNI